MVINNDGKATAWRIVDIIIILVVALVGSLWAITWKSTDTKACDAISKTDKLQAEIQLTKEFIAEQKLRNLNIEKKLDEILAEIKVANGTTH
jgi:hypothetical protein